MLGDKANMKKYRIYTISITIVFLSILIIGNMFLKSTINYVTPEYYLEEDANVDLFTIKKRIYVNAEDMNLSKEMTLEPGKLIGKIKNTGIYEDFKSWNATKLEVDTPIYKLKGYESDSIVLVKVNDEYIPYYGSGEH